MAYNAHNGFMPKPGTRIRRDRMEYEVDRNGSWRRVRERASKKSREIKRKRARG